MISVITLIPFYMLINKRAQRASLKNYSNKLLGSLLLTCVPLHCHPLPLWIWWCLSGTIQILEFPHLFLYFLPHIHFSILDLALAPPFKSIWAFHNLNICKCNRYVSSCFLPYFSSIWQNWLLPGSISQQCPTFLVFLLVFWLFLLSLLVSSFRDFLLSILVSQELLMISPKFRHF